MLLLQKFGVPWAPFTTPKVNIKPKAHASLTKSEVCEVLDEDVGCVFGPDRSRLEEPEARLHENDD